MIEGICAGGFGLLRAYRKLEFKKWEFTDLFIRDLQSIRDLKAEIQENQILRNVNERVWEWG
jgi:hypothetical protein